ncbi:MAG: hypothetical protein CL774_01415 [Chloroflexi bacterium]|nr:hypothetical protein [Chloroflexota bacterium]
MICNYSKFISRFLYLSIFIFTIFLSTTQNLEEIFAQEIQNEKKYNSIIVDEQIIRSDRDEIALNTALKIIDNSSQIENIFVGTFDSDSTKLNFYSEVNKEVKWIDDLLNSIENTSTKNPNIKSDQLGALTDIYSEFNKLNALAGSNVLIITPGRISGESEKTRERFRNIGELFALEEWTIDVVTLPSSDLISRDLMGEISSASLGKFFDLGTLSGFSGFVNYLKQQKLTEIMKSELGRNNPKLLPIDISPFTQSLSLLLVREDFDTEVSLFSPNGTKALPEMSNVDVLETMNLDLITINNPSPGTWSLRSVSETGGEIQVYSEIQNPLELKMIQAGPFSNSEPVLIEASINIDNSPQIIADAVIEATVTNGIDIKSYKLNDSGLSGDKKSNDGIYSFEIVDNFDPGTKNIDLELSWPEFSSKIITRTSFQTEIFPKINITRTSNVEGSKDENLNVASITLTVSDYPFLTNSKNILGTLSNDTNVYDASLTMLSEPEPGKSWKFDVFAKISESGNYKLNLKLEDKYLDRNFEVSSPDTEISANIITYPIKLFGIRIIYILILIFILGLLTLSIVIIRRKNSPYGYLIDDQGKVLVNFYNLDRSQINKIISKDFVNSYELKAIALNSGGFKFLPNNVELRLTENREDISVRVNGKPAPTNIKLSSRNQVGVGGKLFSFYKRLPKQ